MTVKERLHLLIEALPDHDLAIAHRFLEHLQSSASDPLLLALLNAPYDDESEAPEEATELAEARADLAAGRVVEHGEARRRLLSTP